MQLQRSLDEITRQGLGLAAISYDAPEVLRAFSARHGITFPLLSDAGSKTIAAWGLLNHEATGRSAGIPHPGTFVIDREGVIASRAFEPAYQERDTAASVLTGLADAAPPARGTTEAIGKHLTVRAGLSDGTAAPGHRITLIIDVTPGPKIHVYAPGQRGYIPIALKLDASADFKTTPARYPAPRDYFFAPLKETVKIYDRPFRILQDVTLALTPALRQRAAARETLALTGALDYQACDDQVCFRPDTVPLSWTIALSPIER